jgi:hypothetical protein
MPSLGEGPVAGCCEQGDEPLGCVDKEFVCWLVS